MGEVKELFHNKWVSVNDNNGFIFSHEPRCHGHIVAVLPFERIGEGGLVTYMLRKEWNPAWNKEHKLEVTCITGGMEPGMTEDEVAVMELREEGGYDAEPREMISLGRCRGIKSNDNVYHLFAVDVTGKDRVTPEGDGSELESAENAFCYFSRTIDEAVDPLVYTMFYRLSKVIKTI